MAQRSHVPKFGNWESEENVPYTVYFDKARKGRTGGKLINPNDPQENPDILANIMPPSQASPSRSRTEPEEPNRREAAKPRRGSGESGEFRQSSDSPAHNDNMGRRGTGDSAHQRHGGRGSSSGQPQRRSTDYSVDRSPLHPHYQAKIVAKGSASPAASEGRNSYDSSQGAPGRTRMRAANRGDETPDRGAAVPKFGEWDENNPSCADGYTHIFNKVREERHGGAGNSVSNEPSYTPIRRKTPDAGTKICCFPWVRK